MGDHRRTFTFNSGEITGCLNEDSDDQIESGELKKRERQASGCLSDQKVGVGPKGPVKSLVACFRSN